MTAPALPDPISQLREENADLRRINAALSSDALRLQRVVDGLTRDNARVRCLLASAKFYLEEHQDAAAGQSDALRALVFAIKANA